MLNEDVCNYNHPIQLHSCFDNSSTTLKTVERHLWCDSFTLPFPSANFKEVSLNYMSW